MPYKSDAQRRLFHAKLARGEMSATTVREFDAASKGRNLPERIGAARSKARPFGKRRQGHGQGHRR